MAASEVFRDNNGSIDKERRNLMNTIVLASAAVSVTGIAVPFLAFFMPPGTGGDSNAPVVAKDILGQDIVEQSYLESKPVGDRSLVQGLLGDPTYLLVKDDHKLESFALNAGTFI